MRERVSSSANARRANATFLPPFLLHIRAQKKAPLFMARALTFGDKRRAGALFGRFFAAGVNARFKLLPVSRPDAASGARIKAREEKAPWDEDPSG